MNNKLFKITLLIAAILLPIPGFSAQELQAPQQLVRQRFELLFLAITEQLSTQYNLYMDQPQAYSEFIDSRIKSSWDVPSTASALVGKGQFQQFDEEQKAALVAAVDRTLVRYAFEGLEHYGGQLFRVVDVAVNKRRTMGWVQVLMESPIIPDLNLDLLIKRTSSGDWKAVDIRFKGITYVAIKKHQFREIIEAQGVDALIATLEQKNDEFFNALCATTSAELKGVPPC
jgi:phospholipid transport system substrate-binding protein